MRKLRRHPVAVAWDIWMATEGKSTVTIDKPVGNPFLQNRVQVAFLAGWDYAKLHAGKKAAEKEMRKFDRP